MLFGAVVFSSEGNADDSDGEKPTVRRSALENNPLIRQQREREEEAKRRETEPERPPMREHRPITYRDRRYFSYGPTVEVVVIQRYHNESPEKARVGAWVLLERGAYREARMVFRELQRIDPRNGETMVGLSLAELFNGEYREAVKGFSFILRRMPDEFEQTFVSLSLEEKLTQRMRHLQAHRIPFLEDVDRFFLIAVLGFLVEDGVTSRSALQSARSLQDQPALTNLARIVDPPASTD